MNARQARNREAAFRKKAAEYPRASKEAQRWLDLAEEQKQIAERRERVGWH